MPFVVELYFDPSTEEGIRGAWKAIDEAGINSAMLKGGYRPHVSLGVCDHLETLMQLAQELSTFVAGVVPFRFVISQYRHFFYIRRSCFLRCNGYRAIA